MICRLCLKSATDTIHIFDDIGQSLNVAAVLAKFFWFSPKSDDPISTVVCADCWARVNDFNEFYEAVEKAHRLLTERFSIKNTSANTEEQENDAIDEVEEDEEQMLYEEVLEEDVEESEASFNNEQFLNDMWITQDDEESDILDDDTPFAPTTTAVKLEDCRETRSASKRKSDQSVGSIAIKVEPDGEPIEKVVRKRGRPRKGMEKPKVEVQRTKRYADYKQTMLEIDQKIKQHMRLTCDVCHAGQETFLELCKHMMQAHRKKGYAICCNKKFYKRSFLTDHIDRHSNPDKFKCELCGKSFADKQCLRNHELLKHQADEDKIYQCEHCPKRYTKQYLLDQHRIIHKERTMPCDICDRRFPNISLLGTHIRVVHGNYGTMCDICALVIRGRAAFKRHQLEHAGITEPKVQCDICGSWHKNKYSLKKHINRHNGANEECTCSICGKVSPNRSAMLSHQRYVHLADRKFECGVCNKAFKKAITLKEHMTMHTGEVLYQCPHCPKTFNSNANKHSHRKKCHPKEFEETRKARNENRAAKLEEEEEAANASIVESIITITTGDDDGEEETHNILVTAEPHNPEEHIDVTEFTLCLSDSGQAE